MNTSVQSPVITPTINPEVAPVRRQSPDEICPAQKHEVVKRVIKHI